MSPVLLGACAGTLCSGRLTDRFGRKVMLIADAVLFMIEAVITVMSPAVSFLIAVGKRILSEY